MHEIPLNMNSKAMAGWGRGEGRGEGGGYDRCSLLPISCAVQRINLFDMIYIDDIIPDPCDINLPRDINICVAVYRHCTHL